MLANVGFGGLGQESEDGDGGVGRTRGFRGLVEQPEYAILQAAGGRDGGNGSGGTAALTYGGDGDNKSAKQGESSATAAGARTCGCFIQNSHSVSASVL